MDMQIADISYGQNIFYQQAKNPDWNLISSIMKSLLSARTTHTRSGVGAKISVSICILNFIFLSYKGKHLVDTNI